MNIHLTGLISRLARFPISVLHTILIRPDIPTTSDVPSFHQVRANFLHKKYLKLILNITFQVLKILKQQIDAELPITETTLDYVEIAKSYLIEREHRLTNARKNAIDANKQNNRSIANNAQLQLTPSSSYDPFNRNERTKKSLTNTLNTFFRRPNSAGMLFWNRHFFVICF